jgi:hypothetical protein
MIGRCGGGRAGAAQEGRRTEDNDTQNKNHSSAHAHRCSPPPTLIVCAKYKRESAAAVYRTHTTLAALQATGYS